MKVPEPVAWRTHRSKRWCFAYSESRNLCQCGGSWEGLVTIGQAEAYAAAKVREALEEAANVCDAYFKETEEQSRSTYEEGKLDAADILEQRIRALIPSQTGDSNVEPD